MEQPTLKEYSDKVTSMDLTIEQHHKVLEQSDDAVSMHRQQGAIMALRKLKMLRDEVNG